MGRVGAVGLAILATLLPACHRGGADALAVGVATFHTASGDVRTGTLSVAITEAERKRGLMGRTTLDENWGEVFVFDGTVQVPFWMKDTPIPLSIAFWNAGGSVVDIRDMRPCTADPCPLYRSRAPYTHALEMNVGWFASHGVKIGDTVELSVTSR